jgi:hypothetical protein
MMVSKRIYAVIPSIFCVFSVNAQDVFVQVQQQSSSRIRDWLFNLLSPWLFRGSCIVFFGCAVWFFYSYFEAQNKDVNSIFLKYGGLFYPFILAFVAFILMVSFY